MPQEHQVYRVKFLYLTLYQNKPFQRFNTTIWRARIPIMCSKQSEVPPKVAPTHSCWFICNCNMEVIAVEVNICLLSRFMPMSGNWLKVCISLRCDPIYCPTFRHAALALEIANMPGIHWIAALCTPASGTVAVLAEAIFTKGGSSSLLKRETLVWKVSRRGCWQLHHLQLQVFSIWFPSGSCWCSLCLVYKHNPLPIAEWMDSLSWKKKADQENDSPTYSAGILVGGLEGWRVMSQPWP